MAGGVRMAARLAGMASAILAALPSAAAGRPKGGLQIREYPIMREDPRGRTPDVMAGLPADAGSALRGIDLGADGHALPAGASDSGYSLLRDTSVDSRSGPAYSLFIRGRRVLDGIRYVGKWETVPGHSLLAVWDDRFGTRLIHDFRLLDWERNRHGGTLPILTDVGLLSVEWAREPLSGNDSVEYLVRKGEGILYRFRAYDPVQSPIRAFFMHRGKWHLQVKDRLIVDGKDWNRRMGMESVYNARVFAGEPAWFAVRSGERKAYLYRGGIRTGKGYDRVLHDLCCGMAMQNIVNGRDEIGFFGLRAGTWYFIVVRA